MKFFSTIIAGIALLLIGCEGKGPRFDPRAEQAALTGAASITNLELAVFTPLDTNAALTQTTLPTPPPDLFRIGPGDVIDVEVIGEPANTTSLVVGPDGKIYYGLLPGTFVWGLTLGEAKKVLEDSLAKYIRARPEVAVTLRTVGSKHIWLLGNVTRPGVYPVAAPMSLLEAIALAGGTLAATGTAAETVDLSRSFVMRDGQPLAVDFYRLLREGDLSQNIFLLPNDFVYLRPGISEDVYVLGGVTTPNVVVFNNQMTLVAAIAACGGPIQYAYLSHVAIIRGSLSRPMIATVNYREIVKGQAPDVLLQQGDIVYVPMSPYRYIQEFGLQVISQFVRTVAINEGRAAVDPRLGPAGVGRFLGNSGTDAGTDTTSNTP